MKLYKFDSLEVKVCDPNPCRHGGKCTALNPRQFLCDCTNTRYEGAICEIGVIEIPDFPSLVAGVPVESVEFRASPPDNYVILTPQAVGVDFDPQYLLFQQNATTNLSLTMTAQHPGLHFVRYYLSGPSAVGYQTPSPNTFFVKTVKKTASNISRKYDNMEFPSGCYKLELGKCPRSNATITAHSTSSWFMFGPTATTDGQVSLRNGNMEIPHSMTGYSLISENPSSLNNDCVVNLTEIYPAIELIKRRILTKSFLKVIRQSLPKWLDIKLRENHSSSSMVETDLQAFYLTGKRLREEAFIEGQPFADDTYFSLLLLPDLDVIVNNDRASFGLNDRNARFSLALELCGILPNVILQPPPENVDVIDKLPVMNQLRDIGWNFKIFSLQISTASFGNSAPKKSLTMHVKFSKKFVISRSLKSRVDFRGTAKLNVDNLNNVSNQIFLVK